MRSRRLADDGRLPAEEFAFEHAYRELTERVHDEVFLVTAIERPAPSSAWELPGLGNLLYGICWLAPVYPKAEAVTRSERFVMPSSKPADLCPASVLHFTVIDTVRPTLRWSVFPRDHDRRRLDPAVLQKISDVTYDLKIWEAEGCERSRLVYERAGLAGPLST